MIATPQLISALRRAADAITDSSNCYDWQSPSQCNCGWLARSCGVSTSALFELRGYWHENARNAARCPATLMPMPEVWRNLLDTGVEFDDFEFLEFCDSPEVLVRLGWEFEERYEWNGSIISRQWESKRCAQPANVARYFRAQADLLEEQLAPTPPALVLAPAAWPMVAMQATIL